MMRTPTEYEIENLYNSLSHEYDPVKAHEYYIKNRELKGRKGSKKTEKSKLVSRLAYRQEGGSAEVAAQVVNWAQTKTDTEIKSKIKEIEKKYGTRDATMAFTLNQLLENRDKIRAKKTASGVDPRTGKTREQIHKDAVARQRKELSDRISSLSKRLSKLESLIKERESEERSEDRKAKAKKERAAKERDKPKTAAEKAEAARDAEKYRDKHKQELKNKSDDKKSGSSSDSKKKSGGKHTSSELRSLATKVRGQIAIAKQKLSAL